MFGYNGKPWTYSYYPEDQFEFDVPPPRGEYGSLREELPRTAKKIAELFHGETIHIMHGGGMDSEAIIWGFQIAGVPFKSVCVADTGGVNHAELKAAHAEKYYEVDVKDWLLSDECRTLAHESQQVWASMMFLSHTLLHHLRGKVVIIGFTEPELEQGALTEYECFMGVWKFFFQHGILGVPLFWSSFPSLWYGYLQGLMGHGGDKMCLYQSELGLRPRPKINWHSRIQYWGPAGIWSRKITMSPHRMLARAELGLV